MAPDHGHDHSAHAGHAHTVSADADRSKLTIALALILGFMAVEVVVGIIANSLALLSDAAHMLTDAGALVLALVAISLAARPARGALTFGWQRAGILSAQFNGATLLVLGLLIVFEGIRRLIDPPDVEGGVVFVVAILGIVVNLLATWTLSKANRTSLNVEGAFQHILTDLAAFVFTAIAGLVILTTGFDQADGIASLIVAAIMLRAAYGLLVESGRVFLEASPRGLDPEAIGNAMAAVGGRRRGPRPARLGGHLGLSGALRTRPRRRRHRLPRDPPGARARDPRDVRDRPHDHAGRAPSSRRAAPGRGRVRLGAGLMIEQLVNQIEERFAGLERQLSDPEVIADRERYAAVGREYSELEDANRLAREWRTLNDDLEGARELLADDEDEELRRVVAEAPARLEELAEAIRLAMVESDPNDDKNVLVEIRAGAGGDEAALFAGDLYKMLSRYAEERGFGTEILSQSPAEVGGFKEVTFAIKGDGAYSVFKYEGGTHRVQRVPKTESQGRIHTSTATVAVLPEAEEVDIAVDPNDLQIDVYRSSGPGGQSVNTTDSAVRITHEPSGIVVSMQDEKSQLQNRDKAMRVLRARLLEKAIADQQAEISAERRSQVGTGERSEKVRTYNFPQGRVTDHRIKLTSHALDEILAGDLREFSDALGAEEKRRKLEAQAAGAG